MRLVWAESTPEQHKLEAEKLPPNFSGPEPDLGQFAHSTHS